MAAAKRSASRPEAADCSSDASSVAAVIASQVRGSALACAVLRRDDLALLGDADAALHGPRRLRENRGERGAAAAPHGAAAAMKDLHRDARVAEHAGEREGCLVQTPHRGQVAAVLVRIGVPDHDLLIAASASRLRHARCRKPGLHDARRVRQIADRLEQRHDHDRRGGRVRRPIEPRLLEQDVHFEQVGDAAALGHDVGRDRRRPVQRVRLGGGVDDGQLRCGLAGVGRERTRERPLTGELAGQQRDARRFVETPDSPLRRPRPAAAPRRRARERRRSGGGRARRDGNRRSPRCESVGPARRRSQAAARRPRRASARWPRGRRGIPRRCRSVLPRPTADAARSRR